MSIYRLREFFDYAELEFSIQPEQIKRLKELLFLDLKSSEDGKIAINGNVYTKNDFLTVFNQTYCEDSFDLRVFLANYPAVQPVLNPQTIDTCFAGNLSDARKDKHWHEAVNSFSEQFFVPYYKALKECANAQNFLGVHQLLTYVELFEPELILKAHESLKQVIRGFIKTIFVERKEVLFLASPDYYKVLRILTSADSRFLVEQYNSSVKFTKKLRKKEGAAFFELQLSLNFPKTHISQIKNHQQDHYFTTSLLGNRAGKIETFARIGMMALLAAVIIYYYGYSTSEDEIAVETILLNTDRDTTQQGIPIDSDDTIDSLIMKMQRRESEKIEYPISPSDLTIENEDSTTNTN